MLREASDTVALAEQVNDVLTPTADGGLTDGDVVVQVHREGPLKTTLRATRNGRPTPPSPRRPSQLVV